MRAFLLLFLQLFVACGDTIVASPTATTTTPTSDTISVSPSESPHSTPSNSPSGSPTADPTPEPELQLPADAPILVDDRTDLARVATGDLSPLAPPRSEIAFTAVQVTPQDPIDQIALAWRRGKDVFASTRGLVLWQRFEGPVWRALYAFTDRPSAGVLGISLTPGDLTGDGVADLLTNELTGGTGACGRWRVVASEPGRATEIFRRDTCDTEIVIAGGELRLRKAVYEQGDPHCCPSAFRVTTLRWDGVSWRKTSSEIVPVASG